MKLPEIDRFLYAVITGKVNSIVTKKDEWSQTDLRERHVQFGSVIFSYRDIISFSEIFTLVDTDGSGQISASEAKHLLNLIGEQVELSDVENLISEFDLDGNGEVSLPEFVFVLALQRKSEFSKKDVMRCGVDPDCPCAANLATMPLSSGIVLLSNRNSMSPALFGYMTMIAPCSAFDLFARGTQTRQGVINKDVLQQNLVEYGISAATERDIQKLVASLPCADNSVNEFDYVKHIATFLS